MNKKLLYIFAIIFILLAIGAGRVFYYLKITEDIQEDIQPVEELTEEPVEEVIEEKQPVEELTAEWSPEINLADWYWKEEIDLLTEETMAGESAKEAIEFANNSILEVVGKDFFNNYVHHYPPLFGWAHNIYYLEYIIIIPEKGIDYKTTTHPVTLEVNVRKTEQGLKIEKNLFENISEYVVELNFIDRNEALEIARKEIGKDIPLLEKVIVDFKIVYFKPGLNPEWVVRYDLPQERTPYCSAWKMGAHVSLKINAITKKVERKVDCIFPGT